MGIYRYEVALSFAGEDRAYVHTVAQILSSNDVSVFYDNFEKVELWGKDLVEFFDKIFRLESRYCIMFVSAAYKDKIWTIHERRSALAREIQERAEYILPARFDDTELPGFRPTIGYIDLKGVSPEEFATLVLQKIGKISGDTAVKKELSFRVPHVKTGNFNPYSEAFAFISQVRNEIESRCISIAHLGISFTAFGQDHDLSIRVVANGEALFSMNMRLDESFGAATITFGVTRGVSKYSSSGFNAWGKMEQNPDNQSAILRLNDLGLFHTLGGEVLLTAEQFINNLWEIICDEIENRNKGGRR